MRFEETAKKIGILALLAAVSASAAACGSENMVKAPVVGTLDPAQGGTAGAGGAEGNGITGAVGAAESGTLALREPKGTGHPMPGSRCSPRTATPPASGPRDLPS